MAAKSAVRRARKPRSAKKRAARRATRRAARKARRAAKPKAPKAARKPRAPKASKKRAVRRTKPKKPKRVTKKMQTGSMRKVWNGSAKWTAGGLTKDDLMKNSRGCIVSKKMHAKGQTIGKSGWTAAVMKARKELGITGFCVINRGDLGIKLYNKAKELHN